MASSADIYHEGENIYVNLSLYNNQDTQINAAIDVALEKPIVEKANEYKLSVIRFTCPLGAIPRYNFIDNTINVAIHYPGGGGITGYGSGTVTRQPDSVAYFIILINQAFAQAYTNFAAVMNSKGFSMPSGIPPYFMYDPRNRLMSFVVNSIFVNNTFTNPPVPIQFYVANDVFDYIYSFPTYPTSIIGYTRLNVLTLDIIYWHW
jgi:hypothetical protein